MSSPLRPAIVLVAPQEDGNIGAAARAMANMGLDELVLVSPARPLGPTAYSFAVGARHILQQACTCETLDEALASRQLIVGTTSARGRGLPLPVLDPRELPHRLLKKSPDTSTAVIFGPETCGLDNEQLARCGLVIRVPCAPEQPTLNLAQAVLILAYELYLARRSGAAPRAELPPPASTGQLEGLFAQLVPLLNEIGFARDDTFEGVLRDLRRLAARAGPTAREVGILRGVCRRARRNLAGPAAARGRTTPAITDLDDDRLPHPMVRTGTRVRDAVLSSLRSSPIVGVVRTRSEAEAARQAGWFIRGGIELIEITFTVPQAVALVEKLLAERRGGGPPWIGMGTVTDISRADAAVEAGAEFLVSPNTSSGVASVARHSDLLLIMGALTVSEIVEARDLGADIVKVYPLAPVGGAAYLATIRQPLDDIPMLAAGGFEVEDIPAYRSAGAMAFGIGAPLLSDTEERTLERIARALELARGQES